jgi:tetratricopeptide (TPR) repeat protein
MKYQIIKLLAFIGLTIFCSGMAHAQGGSSLGSNGDPALMSRSAGLAQLAAAALDAGNYVDAEANARQIIALGIGQARGRAMLASALAAEGKTQEAMSEYSTLSSMDYPYPNGLLPYALLLLKQGQWAEALAVYNKAVPRVGNAQLLLFKGHELLAEDADFSADNPQPKQLETDIHIAMGLSQIDDYGISGEYSRDKAVAEFRAALKLEPDSPLAHLGLAGALRADGKPDDGMAELINTYSTYSGDIKAEAKKEIGTYPISTPATRPN